MNVPTTTTGAAVVAALVFAFVSAASQPRIGRVMAPTGTPLIGATVAALRADSTVLAGAVTDTAGRFQLTVPSSNATLLRVRMVGYSTRVLPLDSFPNADMGDIVLAEREGKEVVVEQEREQYTMREGRREFRVEGTPAENAGAIVDVLRQVPLVDVDAEGNVSLTGSQAVRILIDDKPVQMYGSVQQVLASVPSTMIERVDVMTSPGARYSAEGQAGIINIVLKKRRESGKGAMVQSTLGTLDRYGLATFANSRNDDGNLFGSLDVTFLRNQRIKEVASVFDDGLNLRRDGPSVHSAVTGGLRLGYEAKLSATTSATITGDVRLNDGTQAEPYRNSFSRTGPAPTPAAFVTDQTNGGPSSNSTATAVLTHALDDKGSSVECTLMGFYQTFDMSNRTFLRSANAPASTLGGIETVMFGSAWVATANVDATLMVDSAVRVLAGAASAHTGIASNFDVFSLAAVSGASERDAGRSSWGVHRDDIVAAYVDCTVQLGDISLTGGLRGEHTINAFSIGRGEPSDFDRAYGNLFPSANMTWDAGGGLSLNGGYTRRIQRPDGTQINPFIDQSDTLNWRTGNPALLPEFTDAFEGNVVQQLGGWVLSAGGFHRTTTNVMNLRFREEAAPGILLEKPYNFGTATSSGIALTARGDVIPGMTMSGEYAYFQQDVVGTFRGTTWNSEGFGWNAKLMCQATLPAAIRAQLAFSYTAPQVIPQGRRYEFNLWTLTMSRAFFEDRLTVAATWTDIFNTARFGGEVQGQGFSTVILNQRDFALFHVTFSYRINDFRQSRAMATPPPSGGV
ncbi:MAG: TonB-dependent receptor [Candidatus Kapabacteria bacterium]|nr:TonB-dependent receptor [Candidatus Kapabacteria bacterium]